VLQLEHDARDEKLSANEFDGKDAKVVVQSVYQGRWNQSRDTHRAEAREREKI